MILIDTHVMIWASLSPEKLSTLAQERLELTRQASQLAICDITLWETAMLIEKGRIAVGLACQPFLDLMLTAFRLTIYPITPEIAAQAISLPPGINSDPADRLIVATALTHQFPLITADRNLRQTAGLQTIW